VTTGARVGLAVGAACAVALLLAPALLPADGADALLSSVLPLGFFAAGGVAQVLRPGHPVADRMLAVGVLHLTALLLAAALLLTAPADAVGVPLAWLSAALYALGFVALLDLLARYPTGAYAWAPVRPAVRLAGGTAVLLATLALLGSHRIPLVLGSDLGPNPVQVAALEPLAGAIAAVVLLPVGGLVLLLIRYRSAPAPDRAQMRWPMVTAGVVAVGLVTTGWAEEALGDQTQAALFVAAGAALPASFLVGLLRHTEAAERLAAVEASRARLAEVADAERRRIERDLHDGAQQQILALLAQVELTRAELGGRDGEVDRELQGIGEGLRQAHRDLRELARGVHPAVLTDQGLPEAVRSALARLPLPTELVVAPEVAGTRFPPAVEAAAYFLVLEGLTNAMKHASAPSARVTLDLSGGMLQVTVSDPGRGFDPGRSGSGLVGLRDRLAATGGRLEVESRLGGGTTLRGLLPVAGRAG
jgi:signal transduction histidine kinase